MRNACEAKRHTVIFNVQWAPELLVPFTNMRKDNVNKKNKVLTK